MVGLTLAVMIVGAMIAAYTDARTRRIPNQLTAALAAIALAAAAANGGLMGAATAALVMVAAFALGTLAFSLGWFGGGDVKLLAGCCGLAGYPGAISIILYTLVAGGFVCLVEALRRRRLRTLVASTVAVVSTGVAPAERTAVPYAIAIFIGACTYALSLTIFPPLRLHL